MRGVAVAQVKVQQTHYPDVALLKLTGINTFPCAMSTVFWVVFL
jgi:hypothetical protein